MEVAIEHFKGHHHQQNSTRQAQRVNADAEEGKQRLTNQERCKQDKKHSQGGKTARMVALACCHARTEQDDDGYDPDRIKNREQADKYLGVFGEFEHGYTDRF